MAASNCMNLILFKLSFVNFFLLNLKVYDILEKNKKGCIMKILNLVNFYFMMITNVWSTDHSILVIN